MHRAQRGYEMAADKRHQSIGHYVVLKLIGKGSYGQVHLVKNRRDKRQVKYYKIVVITSLLFTAVCYEEHSTIFLKRRKGTRSGTT